MVCVVLPVRGEHVRCGRQERFDAVGGPLIGGQHDAGFSRNLKLDRT
jgi:hypothetical protein